MPRERDAAEVPGAPSEPVAAAGPFAALAPSGAAEAEPPAAGTAAGDAAPSGAEAAAPSADAGTEVGASVPSADAAAALAAESAAAAAAVAGPHPALVPDVGTAAYPDGPASQMVASAAQLRPDVPSEVRNPGHHRGRGPVVPDGRPVRDVLRGSGRSHQSVAMRRATDVHRGGHPAFPRVPVLESVQAARYPDEDFPAGHHRAADPDALHGLVRPAGLPHPATRRQVQ